MRKFFVAGTDTEVGKTYVSCRLLELAHHQGMSSLGLKPVAAGCELDGAELKNEDAIALMHSSSIKLPYAQVNPVALPDPCSPHIAATRAGKSLNASRLAGYCRGALLQKVDFALVEGAGGWRVPISPRETMASLAVELDYPVVLVVGLRLGCINHALLTAEAVRRDGLEIAGWVGNQITDQPMSYIEENVATLRSALGAPFIGVVPYETEPRAEKFSNSLDISCLTV
ncbi:dethiobiotin synthase [Oleiphilus sp. HI0071]|nr:dethiobiotin synthase [Oleiphilus sp. HI0080]KZY67425.1 dethiobiotin synthase [Oleiphilus sp. HI0065]KZY81590.1 dethiobiotin synthase [Oleiphilus sp. HI0071]KZY89955.1 dethiobiotin synthase [Oleiphilus sp. HI0073]KZZ40628.1 dethiobiotin synthase [Oleiphilus sp. HI0118]KZZ52060.1 dethiobiotin synthase [Oleiphilus sp. HI0122]KZZ65443.1 dethiobiotin synthase [Oleiphilus sp. HI0130]KZZ82336.1 dethiobiotin synthase [Oleiphilus sp. HI0133]